MKVNTATLSGLTLRRAWRMAQGFTFQKGAPDSEVIPGITASRLPCAEKARGGTTWTRRCGRA